MAATANAATLVVAPRHLNGWEVANDTCGADSTASVGFVTGPDVPPAGAGSLRLSVGSNGDSYLTLRTSEYAGVKLSSLTALAYSTYVSTANSGQAPYLDLYVDVSGDGVRDDILTFEPIYQSGPVLLSAWQRWNALRGRWWSDARGGPPPLFTLASYVAAHPNARIVGTGSLILGAGCGGAAWTSFSGYADRLTIGVNRSSTTFDLEAKAPKSRGGERVRICHKGKTITVGRSATKAHLRHGDTIGPCR
jgi:hypothetical protein